MRTLLVVVAVCGVVVAGCSEDEEETGSTAPGSHEPCRSDPSSCPAEETCWVTYEQTEFVCQTSGAGGPGASCVNTFGQPTCGDSLGCYQVVGSGQGVCSPFCDPVDPAGRCLDGAACRPILYRLSTGDVVIHMCAPAGAGG